LSPINTGDARQLHIADHPACPDCENTACAMHLGINHQLIDATGMIKLMLTSRRGPYWPSDASRQVN